MSSTSSSDDGRGKTFGPLVSIPAESLVRFAADIRQRVLAKETSTCNLVSRISGSYNIAHILQLDEFKLVIRVPATGWGGGITSTAALAIKSQVDTLRLIKRMTEASVPVVYAFDSTCENEIGAPYICMSFIPGQPVRKAWFDKSITPQALERRRFRTLTTLAQGMAQLSRFSFEQIGCLHEDDKGKLAVGPCFNWYEYNDGSLRIRASGPYASTSAYLNAHSAPRTSFNEWCRAESEILDIAVTYFPTGSSSEGFVLTAPDLDSQNVLVDDDGTVTGVLDWDHVQTVPRCVGYSSYPSWITRDWDPLMYGWPRMKDQENSPDELRTYREYYDQQMGAALAWKGDWVYTKKSHIREAVWIAALHEANRLEICRKMVEAVLSSEKGCQDVDSLNIVYQIGAGYLPEEKWSAIQKNLMALIS